MKLNTIAALGNPPDGIYSYDFIFGNPAQIFNQGLANQNSVEGKSAQEIGCRKAAYITTSYSAKL